MADYLTQLTERILGLAPTVRPAITPTFAPDPAPLSETEDPSLLELEAAPRGKQGGITHPSPRHRHPETADESVDSQEPASPPPASDAPHPEIGEPALHREGDASEDIPSEKVPAPRDLHGDRTTDPGSPRRSGAEATGVARSGEAGPEPTWVDTYHPSETGGQRRWAGVLLQRIVRPLGARSSAIREQGVSHLEEAERREQHQASPQQAPVEPRELVEPRRESAFAHPHVPAPPGEAVPGQRVDDVRQKPEETNGGRHAHPEPPHGPEDTRFMRPPEGGAPGSTGPHGAERRGSGKISATGQPTGSDVNYSDERGSARGGSHAPDMDRRTRHARERQESSGASAASDRAVQYRSSETSRRLASNPPPVEEEGPEAVSRPTALTDAREQRGADVPEDPAPILSANMAASSVSEAAGTPRFREQHESRNDDPAATPVENASRISDSSGHFPANRTLPEHTRYEEPGRASGPHAPVSGDLLAPAGTHRRTASRRDDVSRHNPREGSAETSPQAVRVTIGRVEVRGTPPVSTPPPSRPKPGPALSLDDYLRQRNGRRR